MAVAILAAGIALSPAVASAQNSSGSSGSSSQSQSQNAGQSDPGEGSFLSSILPDFVKGWLGMDKDGGSSGGSQDASAGGSGGGGSGGSGKGGGQGGGQGGAEGGGQQTPAVVATKAEVQPVGERYEFIGRIEAIQKVTVQARVSGFIQEVFFKGGDQIKAGDKLFQIEPDEYEANLQAAQAQLASAKATEAQAQRSLQRNQELAKNGTVSQANLDDARATFEQAQGTRLQAEAQVRQAQLNLDYTTIVAPIDGQISEPLITKGNYVTVSSGALANLIQENPIWGTFPIGENRLSTWRKVGVDGKTRADDAGQAAGFDLKLLLPNEQEYQQSGAFSFVSNTVDAQTGTVNVRVEFPNANGILLPDENVTMVASQKNPPRQPVIPQAAIQLSREGRSVFVLADDDTVHRQPIVVGKQLKGSVAVTDGLKGGEYVIVQGLQNIKDGAKVKPSFQNGEGPTPGASADAEGSASSNSDQGGDRAGGDQSRGDQAGQDGKSAGNVPVGSKEAADSAFGTSTGRSETPSPDAPSNGGDGGQSGQKQGSGKSSTGAGAGGSNQAAGGGKGGDGKDDGRQPHNAAEQRIGTQSASETRAATEAGPANRQTPTGAEPESEPRTRSENTGDRPSGQSGSGNGA